MQNHLYLTSLGLHINQVMRIRSIILTFFSILFFSGWSLRAGPVEPLPQDSSAFLLVASQQITDSRFRKTVLLVTQHGKTGPIGIILNRPLDIPLDEVFPEYPAAKELSLFYGGPVYPRQISYLVRGGDAVEGALTISKNIYLAFDLSTLGKMLSEKRSYTDLRVVHGLASWAPGQLENEIMQGGWFVMPFDDVVAFDLPVAKMWQELHHRANTSQII